MIEAKPKHHFIRMAAHKGPTRDMRPTVTYCGLDATEMHPVNWDDVDCVKCHRMKVIASLGGFDL